MLTNPNSPPAKPHSAEQDPRHDVGAAGRRRPLEQFVQRHGLRQHAPGDQLALQRLDLVRRVDPQLLTPVRSEAAAPRRTPPPADRSPSRRSRGSPRRAANGACRSAARAAARSSAPAARGRSQTARSRRPVTAGRGPDRASTRATRLPRWPRWRRGQFCERLDRHLGSCNEIRGKGQPYCRKVLVKSAMSS